MGIKMRYEDSDALQVFLNGIEKATEEVEDRYLKRAGQATKDMVKGVLGKLATKNNNIDYKHMKDDVHLNIKKDKFGYKVARVAGGKKTGTKWHLVNDGTYRSEATHFMDWTVKMLEEGELESIFEEEMRKAGF